MNSEIDSEEHQDIVRMSTMICKQLRIIFEDKVIVRALNALNLACFKMLFELIDNLEPEDFQVSLDHAIETFCAGMHTCNESMKQIKNDEGVKNDGA